MSFVMDVECSAPAKRGGGSAKAPKVETAEQIVLDAELRSKRAIAIQKARVRHRLQMAKGWVRFFSTEQMILVLKMEDFFEKHGYLGVHWYRQLGDMLVKAGFSRKEL